MLERLCPYLPIPFWFWPLRWYQAAPIQALIYVSAKKISISPIYVIHFLPYFVPILFFYHPFILSFSLSFYHNLFSTIFLFHFFSYPPSVPFFCTSFLPFFFSIFHLILLLPIFTWWSNHFTSLLWYHFSMIPL